ncbi:MAG: MarR family transcriptional regulator [Paucibacter sp.]|nr:MarR family transcriptional regulator [Roseateles sp.]
MKKELFYQPDAYLRDESVGYLLARAKQTIAAACDQRLSAHDLTHSQWVPLLKLSLCGKPSPVATLVSELEIDAGAVTRLIDRLEAKGLVRRERSSEDRRVVLIHLTEEGERLASGLTAVLADVFNAHLKGFSREEWQLLLQLLRRFVANGEALRESSKDK